MNGTTNFILTQMSEHGWGFEDALAEAQRLGYAEADPTADVEGADAAAKCAILASIAFNSRVVAGDVYREGITRVTAQDIADAARLGYVVKLLAIAELDDGEVSARVHPAMVPAAHPLAAVRDAFNAVFVEGERRSGSLMFYGPRRRRRPHGDGGRRRPRRRRAPPSSSAGGRSAAPASSSGRSARWTRRTASTT